MEDTTCGAGLDPRLVGDPVDTLTGAVIDSMLDFRLTGPLELRWTRYYDSSKCDSFFSLGRACAHEFDRTLSVDAEGFVYEEAVRRTLRFPPLRQDGEECALHGFTLQRLAARRYLMLSAGAPAMEFEFAPQQRIARLGRLLQHAHQVRFVYDADLRLVRIDDSAGRHLTAQEDEHGRLVRLAVEGTPTTPGYLLIAYQYDEKGNLVRTANAEGHGYKFAYDDANRVVVREGRKGFRFYYKYDSQGRCVRSMGDDRLFGVVMDYAVPGRVTKVTRPDRGEWTYLFTPQGTLREIKDPLGGSQKFVRDPATGQLMQEIDPNGNLWQFIYDNAGAVVAKLDPLGHRIPLPEDVNAPDPLARQVASNAYEYQYGRWVSVESIGLPDQRQLLGMKLPVEVTSQVFVRAAASSAAPSFKIPPLRVLWWPKPERGRTFNDLGKLQYQIDDFGRQRHWSYDSSGNVAEHIDFDGGRWTYDYGTFHFLRGLTNPRGTQVRFSYTPAGEVASFTDAAGTHSTYVHDLKNSLVQIARHGVIKETYERDACGNLVAKYASDGRELLRMQIGAGNLLQKRTLASGDEHTFTYDKAGRHLTAATSQDRLEYQYDLLGNCSLELRNGLGVAHRYQGWRAPAESVLFGNFVVGYRWQGDTLTITDPGGAQHTIRFCGHGITIRELSNGSREVAQFDALGRCLLKSVHRRNTGLWTRRFHWSGEGELRLLEDNLHGDRRYSYDAAHRLESCTYRGSIEHYQLDEADNLLSQPGLDQVQLLEGNRICAANSEHFVYNDRNNIETRTTERATTRYGYDSRDQLVSAELVSGHWEARYDTFGRRTAKRWNDRSIEYYWNADQLIAEVDENGHVRLYIYADHVALSPLLILDYDSLQAAPEACRRYFVFTDQIGTPVLLENDAGDTVWSAEIAPYGHARIDPRSSVECNLRFAGHYFDTELGLHYNRFRYYDPRLGRYLQSDPWGISGGYNLYAYRSNPLLSVDVLGLGEDSNPSCRPREADAEGDGSPETSAPRRMSPEELQSAADHIRHGGGPRPKDFSTLTVTEGMENGRPVYTVTSSRRPDPDTGHSLTPGERGRAREALGDDVRTPAPGRDPPGENTFHGEQRGARATQNQEDRRQASSNQTASTRRDPDVGHMGAACSACASHQSTATNSQGDPNPITNVTGTIDNGGRTNMPPSNAWRGAPH